MRLAQVAARFGPRWQGQIHHIATDKNSVRGMQWTNRFTPLFNQAGISLQDPANKVYVIGHRGSHTNMYHQAVYDRLNHAYNVAGAGGVRDELRRIAWELS